IFCNWIILSSGFSDDGSSGFLDVYYIDESVLLKSGVKERIKQIVEDRSITKSGFDFKNIYKFLRTYNINLSGRVIDYKIIHLLLNPSSTDVNFEEVVKSYTGVSLESIETSLEKNLGERKLYFLACLIGLYGEIENKLLESLEKEGLSKLYFDIEGPLIRVLAEMEFKGVSVDLAYLNSLIHEYEINIKKLEEEIYNLCNQRFNINSPQQLSNILYGKLGLPVTKKTKKGLSTDAGTLTSIFDKHPVVEKILDYREKVKLKNTYIDVLPGLIDPEDKRIHTTYNQLGTSTGRISSIKPNLQNIPIRTELGREIRKAFIPGDGYNLLMSADYSQIELRVLAHLSEDTSLIEAFNKDEDIHTRTASEIFGVRYEEVDENLRRKAKAINFGIIYGMTEYGLGNRLSISEDEAKEYIKTYFERYPKVKKYIDYLIELAYKRGYTTTLFGRKRYIPELGSSNTRLRSLGERLAVNTPIQGSAADIMKLATVLLFDSLKSKSIDCNIILHVHDELVLELKEKDVEEVRKIVKKSMEDCIKLKVKLKVDIKTGKNWYI
ncbi:MAG: DNA polymerase I, partial [Actinobacteria bacterium]|nr:DNA polymerase I [Actinomycetota bacterium]